MCELLHTSNHHYFDGSNKGPLSDSDCHPPPSGEGEVSGNQPRAFDRREPSRQTDRECREDNVKTDDERELEARLGREPSLRPTFQTRTWMLPSCSRASNIVVEKLLVYGLHAFLRSTPRGPKRSLNAVPFG